MLTGSVLCRGADKGAQDQRVAGRGGAGDATDAGEAVGSGSQRHHRFLFDVARPTGVHAVGRQVSGAAHHTGQPDQVRVTCYADS